MVVNTNLKVKKKTITIHHYTPYTQKTQVRHNHNVF